MSNDSSILYNKLTSICDGQHGHCRKMLTQGSKRGLIPPLKFLGPQIKKKKCSTILIVVMFIYPRLLISSCGASQWRLQGPGKWSKAYDTVKGVPVTAFTHYGALALVILLGLVLLYVLSIIL